MKAKNVIFIVVMTVVATFALLLALGSDEDMPADAAQGTGKFVVSYTAPEQEKYEELHKLLKDERILEEFADGLNGFLALPDNVTMTAAECGVVNAFYNPEDKTITLCYEFVADLLEQAGNSDLEEAEQENYIAGTLTFVLLHEVGHALTHVLELPVTGKEEDAVDQLAAVMLIDDSTTDEEFAENVNYIAHAATWFTAMEEGEYDTEAFADEHSLGEQRYYNVMCWIYGAKPEAAQDLIDDEMLPAARAERCPAEYQQITNSWEKLLEPYTKS